MWYKAAQVIKKKIIPIPEDLEHIIKTLKNNNIRTLIVGGAVRDSLMGFKPKDIDMECYGVSIERLMEILSSVPNRSVDINGQKFGIIKFTSPQGNDYDFSVPRRDSKTGVGHQGFTVEFDPTITPKEAASRRDFTINSLAYDPITHEIIDYFHGIDDIESKILRHTSGAFSEDPLRVLRGLQFAARFGFKIAPETAELAKTIASEHSSISKERIEREWDKLIQKGINVGGLIEYLEETGWIDNYPEIKNLRGVVQEYSWHPEGWGFIIKPFEELKQYFNSKNDDDIKVIFNIKKNLINNMTGNNPNNMDIVIDRIFNSIHKYTNDNLKFNLENVVYRNITEAKDDFVFVVEYDHGKLNFDFNVKDEVIVVQPGDVATHTAHVMNAAVEIANREGLSGDERSVLIYAALAHDFAKAHTTQLREKKGGDIRWTSYGHEKAGGPVAREFLERLGVKKKIIEKVVPLVEYHLVHANYDPKQLPLLAKQLYPATISELLLLIEADHSGRPPLEPGVPEKAQAILDQAKAGGYHQGPQEHFIKWQDLLRYHIPVDTMVDTGNKKLPLGRVILDKLYQLQLKGEIANRDQALTKLQGEAKKYMLIRGNHPLFALNGITGQYIKFILDKAWEAQINGEFNDEISAEIWLAHEIEKIKGSES